MYRVNVPRVNVPDPFLRCAFCCDYSDGTLLKTLGKPDGITRAELQRTAKNVLALILKTRHKELTKRQDAAANAKAV